MDKRRIKQSIKSPLILAMYTSSYLMGYSIFNHTGGGRTFFRVCEKEMLPLGKCKKIIHPSPGNPTFLINNTVKYTFFFARSLWKFQPLFCGYPGKFIFSTFWIILSIPCLYGKYGMALFENILFILLRPS